MIRPILGIFFNLMWSQQVNFKQARVHDMAGPKADTHFTIRRRV